MDQRRTVFISHANPEDNDFASWLGSRLANAGYDVWADILSLVGGEAISPVIGDVIRDQAATVIVALSRASHRKEGVLNEVALASQVGRELGSPRFVIPVVLDDLQTSDFPDELVRRLSIDFSRDWADGLHDVLTALEESGPPKSDDGRTAAMAAWHAYKARSCVLRTDQPDYLYSNWFKLGPFPRRIRYSRFLPSSDVDGAFERFHTPAHRHHRLAISFADARTLMAEAPGVRLEDAYEVDLADFLAGHPGEGPGIFRRDARNIVTAILNEAWGRFCQGRGSCAGISSPEIRGLCHSACSTRTAACSPMTMARRVGVYWLGAAKRGGFIGTTPCRRGRPSPNRATSLCARMLCLPKTARHRSKETEHTV